MLWEFAMSDNPLLERRIGKMWEEANVNVADWAPHLEAFESVLSALKQQNVIASFTAEGTGKIKTFDISFHEGDAPSVRYALAPGRSEDEIFIVAGEHDHSSGTINPVARKSFDLAPVRSPILAKPVEDFYYAHFIPQALPKMLIELSLHTPKQSPSPGYRIGFL